MRVIACVGGPLDGPYVAEIDTVGGRFSVYAAPPLEWNALPETPMPVVEHFYQIDPVTAIATYRGDALLLNTEPEEPT